MGVDGGGRDILRCLYGRPKIMARACVADTQRKRRELTVLRMDAVQNANAVVSPGWRVELTWFAAIRVRRSTRVPCEKTRRNRRRKLRSNCGGAVPGELYDNCCAAASPLNGVQSSTHASHTRTRWRCEQKGGQAQIRRSGDNVTLLCASAKLPHTGLGSYRAQVQPWT